MTYVLPKFYIFSFSSFRNKNMNLMNGTGICFTWYIIMNNYMNIWYIYRYKSTTVNHNNNLLCNWANNNNHLISTDMRKEVCLDLHSSTFIKRHQVSNCKLPELLLVIGTFISKIRRLSCYVHDNKNFISIFITA